jgi:hypothetical protein
VSGGSLAFGEADAPVFSATGVNGTFTASQAGLTGKVSGSVTLPALGLSGVGVSVQLNTTNDPVTLTGTTIAAHSLRAEFTATAAAPVSIAGQTLSGTFAFEQVQGQLSPQARPGTLPPKLVRIAASNVSLFIGTRGATSAGDAGVEVTGGNGFFLLGPGGIAGRLSAHVDVRVPASASAALSRSPSTRRSPRSQSSSRSGARPSASTWRPGRTSASRARACS